MEEKSADPRKKRLLYIFGKIFKFPNHIKFVNTFYPYETWADWYGSTHIKAEGKKYYRVIDKLIAFLEKQTVETIRYHMRTKNLEWDDFIEFLKRFFVHLIKAIEVHYNPENPYADPLQKLYKRTFDQQKDDGLNYDDDVNFFQYLYKEYARIGENIYNTISACSHCDNDAHLQTECCGRVYCAQKCLEADLVEHDLECVDIKLPTWLRRKPDQQVIVVPNKKHTMVYFYQTKQARDKAYRQYEQTKNQDVLQVGSTLQRPIEQGKKYLSYIQNRPGFFVVY